MFISQTIQTEVVTITPNVARKLLEQNVNNRGVSKANLDRVRKAFELGEWQLNGEAIKIAHNGQILDGQHRLMACAQTGIPFETLIVYGLDDDTQKTMDTGKSRTLSDVLKIEGYPNTTNLSAAVVAIIRSEEYSLKSALFAGASSYTVTNKQAIARLQKEPSLVELVNVVKPVTKIGLPGRAAAALYYEFSKIDQEDTEAFFDKLASGAGLERGNPILALRNHLIANKEDGKGSRNQGYIGAITIKAWNKFRAGEQVKVLSFRPGGANPEKFPEAI